MVFEKKAVEKVFCYSILMIFIICWWVVTLASAHAEVPPEVAARMDGDLTPIGAERAGSTDGVIPPWEGGLTEPPAGLGWEKGTPLKDPFPDDKPLFTITRDNMSEYADLLTEGHKGLFNAYDDYRMHVYQTRRTCAYPEHIYQANRNNAAIGHLTPDGNGIAKSIMGHPIPMPSTALEVMWNHMLRYRSFKVTRQFTAAWPTESGDYNLVTVQDDAILHWSDPRMQSAEDLDNLAIRYLLHTVAPSRLAGNVVLVHETVDRVREPRKAWIYSPGTRRVRRAPQISYDNPGTNSDSLQTADSFDIYNGAPDRYNWSFIGKKRKIIPYNNYKMGAAETSYDDIITPRFPNPDLIRYEVHRVWIVEANLKQNFRHIYKKRRFYLDEDSYAIGVADIYDNRDGLWRVQELYSRANYEVPLCGGVGGSSIDLTNGRYLIGGLTNQEPQINYYADELKEGRYTPGAIRRMGTR